MRNGRGEKVAKAGKVYVGFDPGGIGRFGWAVLEEDGLTWRSSGVCDNALEAIENASEFVGGDDVTGIGVDAPLYWRMSGDRQSDKYVRNAIGNGKGRKSSVMHVNSLSGACLVQGVIVARLALKNWTAACLTEAHPKALRAIIDSEVHELESRKPCNETRCRSKHDDACDHERDAGIAAYAAYAMCSKRIGWIDLAEREEREVGGEIEWPVSKGVKYWHPGVG